MSNKIKLFEQFIREFVENSELSFDDIKSAEQGVNSLISRISEYFLISDIDDSNSFIADYEELLDIRVFSELNAIISEYFRESNVSFYDNLQRLSHLLKDVSEQYDYQGVDYVGNQVDIRIDSLVNQLNEIQGSKVNIGGYYMPIEELATNAMRPNETLNKVLS